MDWIVVITLFVVVGVGVLVTVYVARDMWKHPTPTPVYQYVCKECRLQREIRNNDFKEFESDYAYPFNEHLLKWD